MTKFKITREITDVEGKIDNMDILKIWDASNEGWLEFLTKDLPDLIKALQDKEKEIDK